MGAKDILGRVPLEYTDMPVLYSSEMLISLGDATIHKMGAKDILGSVPLEYTDMPVLYSSEMLISLGNATIHKMMAAEAPNDGISV